MSAVDLVNQIRKDVQRTIKSEFTGFELATVVSPAPGLSIRVDNMKLELSAQDLYVCKGLTDASRTVTLTGRPGTVRELGGKTGLDANSIRQPGGAEVVHNGEIDLSYVELKFEDGLKAGERVLVQAAPGGQKYIIVDRVVSYG